MGEVVQFIPKAIPALEAAKITAALLHAGKLKCAEPGCLYGPNGCTAAGCLLNPFPCGGEVKQK